MTHAHCHRGPHNGSHNASWCHRPHGTVSVANVSRCCERAAHRGPPVHLSSRQLSRGGCVITPHCTARRGSALLCNRRPHLGSILVWPSNCKLCTAPDQLGPNSSCTHVKMRVRCQYTKTAQITFPYPVPTVRLLAGNQFCCLGTIYHKNLVEIFLHTSHTFRNVVAHNRCILSMKHQQFATMMGQCVANWKVAGVICRISKHLSLFDIRFASFHVFFARCGGLLLRLSVSGVPLADHSLSCP